MITRGMDSGRSHRRDESFYPNPFSQTEGLEIPDFLYRWERAFGTVILKFSTAGFRIERSRQFTKRDRSIRSFVLPVEG